MSARFRCSSMDKMRPAASPGILGDLNFLFGVRPPDFGVLVGVRFNSIGVFVCLFVCVCVFIFR